MFQEEINKVASYFGTMKISSKKHTESYLHDTDKLIFVRNNKKYL